MLSRLVLIFFCYLQFIYHVPLFAMPGDDSSSLSIKQRSKRSLENSEDFILSSKQSKIQENIFPLISLREFTHFFGFSSHIQNNNYQKYSQEITDFDESKLSDDQKARLIKLCSVPKQNLNMINLRNTFKVVYYIMSGCHHNDIKEHLKLKTLSVISTARLTAYSKGLLTLQEFINSGGRLEVIRPHNAEFSEVAYKKYSANIPDFDDSKLTNDQKERLQKFCSGLSKNFQRGSLTTFKVIYYVMKGFHHEQIALFLNLKNSTSVSTARQEAFNQHYLTQEEFKNSGGRLKLKK